MLRGVIYLRFSRTSFAEVTPKYSRKEIGLSGMASLVSSVASLVNTVTSSNPKEENNKTDKRIGTHNGTFHCDEALGCYMIRLTDKYAGAEIVRTRDPQVLNTLDAVLDVGGVYDPSRDRYDHHQRGFDQVFGHGFVTKLSSAGLIYKELDCVVTGKITWSTTDANEQAVYDKKLSVADELILEHYGLEIIAKELGLDPTHPDVEHVFLAVYRSFVEAIDAIDNGINQYDTDQLPKYVNNTHLSARVGRLNLDWTDEDQSPEKENESFHRAMALAGEEFLEVVQNHAKSWLPARSIIAESIAARKEIDSSGEIVALKQFCPWKLHLFELEEELKLEPSIKYVLYQDDRSKQWRVQAVAVSPSKFESRKPLPETWRGLRDDELSRESGIPDCVFVHISGFIGGNKSFDGALAMARAALKL